MTGSDSTFLMTSLRDLMKTGMKNPIIIFKSAKVIKANHIIFCEYRTIFDLVDGNKKLMHLHASEETYEEINELSIWWNSRGVNQIHKKIPKKALTGVNLWLTCKNEEVPKCLTSIEMCFFYLQQARERLRDFDRAIDKLHPRSKKKKNMKWKQQKSVH